MTTNHLVYGMTTAKTLGFANVHPLPSGLPFEFDRLHIMRLEIRQVAKNLVGFTNTALTETNEGGHGALIYGPTTAYGTTRGAGWVDPEYELDLSSGITLMAVATADTANINTLLSFSNVGEDPSGGPYLQIRTTGGPQIAVRAGSATVSEWAGAGGETGMQMIFGTVSVAGSVGTLTAYSPHNDTISTDTFDATGWTPALDQGLAIHRSGTNFGVATTATLSLVGVALGAQGQAEMLAAYTAFKPWLLARGVAIA